MHVVLAGADLEENLGLGMVGAALRQMEHRVQVVPFNEVAELDGVVRAITRARPALLGLAMQFQHRAYEFLLLAERLRAAGFRGHVTCGGQFATMAWREILTNHAAIDSIVLYEGEQSIVELADALGQATPLRNVPGLAVRGADGNAVRTGPRPLVASLDDLVLPLRYREPSRHFGIPYIPLSGSRGCWNGCVFCSITTFYRDARQAAGGHGVRLRSPRNIAAEMALLSQRARGAAIFCFHDDTFLLPQPADSLARIQAIRDELDDLGVGPVGLVGKCRPECLTQELALELSKLGVIRLYVGVENASQRGQDHLRRRTRTEQLEAAISALNAAGVFGCYNLLLFEPEATLADVRENIAFMRRFPDNPVNFCRAEAYHGTPLHRKLEAAGALGGSYLGWDYRVADDRTELLFRIASAVFRERNFNAYGVANRNMGLGYMAQVLRHFYDCSSDRARGLMARARELSRGATLETADLLEEALELASSADLSGRDSIERSVALLGLRVAAHDRLWHAAFDELTESANDLVDGQRQLQTARTVPSRLGEVVQRVAMAGTLATMFQACSLNDPAPPDAGIDRHRTDGGANSVDAGGAAGSAEMAGSAGAGDAGDAGAAGAGAAGAGGVGAPDGTSGASGTNPVHAAGATWMDPLPADAGLDGRFTQGAQGRLASAHSGTPLVDHWQETTPRRSVRSGDLPLFDPPQIALRSELAGDAVQVTLCGGTEAMSMRWESGDTQGELVRNARRVLWHPDGDDDQLRVVVRTAGGIAVASLRVREARARET